MVFGNLNFKIIANSCFVYPGIIVISSIKWTPGTTLNWGMFFKLDCSFKLFCYTFGTTKIEMDVTAVKSARTGGKAYT
jgi:hypothetical protein